MLSSTAAACGLFAEPNELFSVGHVGVVLLVVAVIEQVGLAERSQKQGRLAEPIFLDKAKTNPVSPLPRRPYRRPGRAKRRSCAPSPRIHSKCCPSLLNVLRCSVPLIPVVFWI